MSTSSLCLNHWLLQGMGASPGAGHARLESAAGGKTLIFN